MVRLTSNGALVSDRQRAISSRRACGEGWVSGIVNEPLFYSRERMAAVRRRGETLARYFEGLHVRVAMLGSEAALAYYARPEVAIETATGLTDRFIAHQPLRKRGRIGHEKPVPIDYLLDRRKVELALHPWITRDLGLPRVIPTLDIYMDSVDSRILWWDPPLMDALKRRGAVFGDFPWLLDEYIRHLPEVPDDKVREDYARARRFYFDHVPDPARETPFRARLGLPPRTASP